jgi:hypothetical protein
MWEGKMSTLVEYTDKKEPSNAYPGRIVSPTRPGPCCWTDMEEIGEPEHDAYWSFRYKRCRSCGFTVRLVLEQLPDAELVADLRAAFTKSFTRGF